MELITVLITQPDEHYVPREVEMTREQFSWVESLLDEIEETNKILEDMH